MIFLLLVMSVKMAPYWGKGGILWLSYLLNEFGDPDFFVWFYFKYIINSMPGKFQHIPISGTITAEFTLNRILDRSWTANKVTASVTANSHASSFDQLKDLFSTSLGELECFVNLVYNPLSVYVYTI